MLDANFWQDQINSKKIIKEKKLYEDLISSYEKSISKLEDLDGPLLFLCSRSSDYVTGQLLFVDGGFTAK